MDVDPVSTIERLGKALGGGPTAVIWACLILAVGALFIALIRAKDRHLAREAQLGEEHQKQMLEIQEAHAKEISIERDKHMATAVQIIPMAQGLLRIVGDLEILAQDARERRRKREHAKEQP